MSIKVTKVGCLQVRKERHIVKRWGIRKWLWIWLVLVNLGAAFGGAGISWAGQPSTPPAGLSPLDTPALMPSFHLSSVDGALFDSAALQGKVVVVRFWATW
jgi:cytochrome oxidase Cu insertion factor (SCO1/SenC/PrrC family)